MLIVIVYLFLLTICKQWREKRPTSGFFRVCIFLMQKKLVLTGPNPVHAQIKPFCMGMMPVFFMFVFFFLRRQTDSIMICINNFSCHDWHGEIVNYTFKVKWRIQMQYKTRKKKHNLVFLDLVLMFLVHAVIILL